MVFHQTALYELIYMVVLFVLLTYVLYVRKPRPGPGHRDGDLLRLLRRRPLRLRLAAGQRRDGCSGSPARSTSASPCSPTSVWIWFRVRKQLAADVADGMPVGVDTRPDDPRRSAKPTT